MGRCESRHRTIVYDHHVQASRQSNFWRGLRGRRASRPVRTQASRCGWRAAHASMAQEMPRSSCCPGEHL